MLAASIILINYMVMFLLNLLNVSITANLQDIKKKFFFFAHEIVSNASK